MRAGDIDGWTHTVMVLEQKLHRNRFESSAQKGISHTGGSLRQLHKLLIPRMVIFDYLKHIITAYSNFYLPNMEGPLCGQP